MRVTSLKYSVNMFATWPFKLKSHCKTSSMPLYADHIWKWPGSSGGGNGFVLFCADCHKKEIRHGSHTGKKIKKKKKIRYTTLLCWTDNRHKWWLLFLYRMRVRSDGAAVPRHRGSGDSHSPSRAPDHLPRVMPRPGSPHKVAVNRGPADSPEKRRLTTFGSSGCINHPDRKPFIDSHAQRSSPGAARHASLGDHKTLEAEALAEVSQLLFLGRCFEH